jgi:hypothetical protein
MKNPVGYPVIKPTQIRQKIVDPNSVNRGTEKNQPKSWHKRVLVLNLWKLSKIE